MSKKSNFNHIINKKIQEQCLKRGIYYCELGFEGCWHDWECHPAHRHKRNWYLGKPELLYDYNQWVIACNHCHSKIEYDAKKTDEVFKKLRPGT